MLNWDYLNSLTRQASEPKLDCIESVLFRELERLQTDEKRDSTEYR